MYITCCYLLTWVMPRLPCSDTTALFWVEHVPIPVQFFAALCSVYFCSVYLPLHVLPFLYTPSHYHTLPPPYPTTTLPPVCMYSSTFTQWSATHIPTTHHTCYPTTFYHPLAAHHPLLHAFLPAFLALFPPPFPSPPCLVPACIPPPSLPFCHLTMPLPALLPFVGGCCCCSVVPTVPRC